MTPAKPAPGIHRAILSLQRLTDLFRERRRQLARAVDLSEAQWRVLEEIGDDEFMPSLFARRQDCAPAAVSRTLRQLLDRGMVAVSIARDDARQRVYRLTGPGRRILGRLRERRERAIETVWSRFGAAELEGFVHFADELADHLEAYAEKRGGKRPEGARSEA